MPRPRSQFFTIRPDPKPVNNFFFSVQKTVSIILNTSQNLTKALPWPVGRYRRILTALTTNQNAGFVTVPSEKKKNNKIMYFKTTAVQINFCIE